LCDFVGRSTTTLTTSLPAQSIASTTSTNATIGKHTTTNITAATSSQFTTISAIKLTTPTTPTTIILPQPITTTFRTSATTPAVYITATTTTVTPRAITTTLSLHVRPNTTTTLHATTTTPTECILWTRKENRAADNGMFYGWTSESNCKAVCMSRTSCVAIDVARLGCVLHLDANDLKTSRDQLGVTQFILDRDCLDKIPRTTETTPTSTGTEMFYERNSLIILLQHK